MWKISPTFCVQNNGCDWNTNLCWMYALAFLYLHFCWIGNCMFVSVLLLSSCKRDFCFGSWHSSILYLEILFSVLSEWKCLLLNVHFIPVMYLFYFVCYLFVLVKLACVYIAIIIVTVRKYQHHGVYSDSETTVICTANSIEKRANICTWIN